MNKKVVIIVSSVIAVVAVAAVAGFLIIGKNNSYRLLKIFEFEGTGSVERPEIGELEPYENMVLESGDTVSLKKGKMVVRADEDKFIYFEDDTSVILNAEGNKSSSRITIDLLNGAISNDIQNKLNDESYYEINTPNSTMSVRGTVFRVWMYEKDGVKYTKVSVFDGEVVTRLVYKDGTVSETEVSVQKGKEVIIYEDGDTTAYLTDPTEIDYEELPDDVIELLIDVIDDGRVLIPTQEELKALLAKSKTVNFMYNGQVFATQTVTRGSTATVPALMPASSGSWDWDFSKPIEEDTDIEWK